MNTASQSVRNILDRRTGPRDWLRRYGYAWIPLPLLFVAVVALWFEDIQDLHESVALLIALNLLLTTLPALGIAFLFARSFLAAGALGVGLFGCGALLLSCSGLAVLGTVFLPSSLFGLNTVVTIHNLNIWAASLCYLAGAALLQRGRFVLKARTPALLAGTVLALAVAALIALTAIQGWTPVFFVQGQGGSPERQTVLVSAIFAIVLTLLLMRRGVSLHSPFGRWFALALMLLAIGYAGIMLQTVFGGVHGWISRAAQYLGGGYMLAAAYAAFRDAEAPFAVQTPLQEKPPHPYAVAIALVLLATVLRVVMLPDLLSRVAFITFYPAVVLAALYGGLRAGAVATAVSAVLAASPWLTASGTPALNWPQDWPALLLFAANCLLISWIAELMQQAQTRLRRVEADRRAELERRVAERTAELQSAKNEAELANEAKSQLLAAAALAEKALRESQERLAAALKAGKLGVHDYEPLTGRIEWDREVRRLWGVPEGEAVTYETFEAGIHPEDVASVKTALASALDPAGPHRFEGEYRVVNRADGSIRWVFADGDVTFEGAQPLRLVGTVQDITERKRAQERIQLLMREVNHRSKNMLSIVQAIARQTAASSPADFLDRFSDRIAALAASQDLLVKNAWKGVALDELVRSQLTLFEDLIGSRIELSGPPLLISAAAAQTLGMAIHELATNAGKYGAISSNSGRIGIEWKLQPAEGAETFFLMSWRESGGPPVEAPERRGFGSVIISDAAEASLEAKVHLDFAAAGLTWQLECPMHEVVDRSQPLPGLGSLSQAPGTQNAP